MKKGILLTLFFTILILIFSISSSISAFQADLKSSKITGYLIFSNSFCIIVRSPSKQLTATIGQPDLSIILKDKTTRITVSGGYLAIEVPVSKIEDYIKKYHLQNLNCIE